MKHLICIVFVIGLITVGCTDKEEIAETERRLGELMVKRKDVLNSLAEKKQELRGLENLIRKEESAKSQLYDLEAKFDPLKKYASHLNEGNDYYDTELKLWRDAHRAALVGEKAGYLSKMDGFRIPKVEIVKVGDEKLEILSNGKPMTVNISELAPSVQRRLVYEPKIK